MKVYFWGTGKGCQKALSNYISDTEPSGFIDNDPKQQGKFFLGKPIYSFREIQGDYDYIIITVMKYDAILYQLQQSEVDMDKVVCYYDAFEREKKVGVLFDGKGRKIDILESRIDELKRMVDVRLRNMKYEIADGIKAGRYRFPIIHSAEAAVERIVNDKCSMIRFGDGEFEMMAGNQRAPFQDYNQELSERLREVIETDVEKILIGIADNYGDLSIYSDETADGIRKYMTDEVRAFQLSVLRPDKIYYNAYMFKCYFPYRDKEGTQKRVDLIKRIWNQRDVVLVEGRETRTGQGNDLLDNAGSVRRILCPTQNAFVCYNEILEAVKKISRESLILCTLGPAAKVLAYDLALCGYQVIDIGQIDMDYEWYRAGQGMRIPIPTKYVSQLPPAEIEGIQDAVYDAQIIECIGE